MTWAYGKAILFGEHAVVYGHPALAGALDLTLSARFAPRVEGRSEASGLRLCVAAWDEMDVDCASTHFVARAVRALSEAVRETVRTRFDQELPGEAFDGVIEIRADLPAAAGLGSSAALCVAVARLLWEVAAGHGERAPGAAAIDVGTIEDIADAGERTFHENPSGVDVALAARGGLGMFVRGRGLEPVHAPPLAIAVGLSGQPRRTADMVARVAENRARDPETVDGHLATLGDIARRGRGALERGELEEIGRLMNQAHEILGCIGVSSGPLDRLVSTANHAGALGAKLTGAGGGGAVIAAARDLDHAEELARAWRDAEFQAFACHVGAGARAPGQEARS